jgi:4,5-dihydroxyphthalate decarboxylase
MNLPTVTLAMRDWEFLARLYGGEVIPEGAQIRLDRKTPMAQAHGDPSIDAAELSLSRFLIALSNGDRSFVGIPFFTIRGFRHRSFFVQRDSGLTDLRQLEGKRIGTNSWPDTGNTWSRAALRDAGVRLDNIRWSVGRVDEQYASIPQTDLPPYVQEAPTGRFLRDTLLDRQLDALVAPLTPLGFYEPNSPIVRLLPDYRQAELAYYRRTALYPAHHIVGLRRETFDRSPQLAVSLYSALDRARQLWQVRGRSYMGELTPWTLSEVEDTMALMGPDWQPSGVTANRGVIAALCEEEYAQGLVGRPIDPETVFAEFDAVMKT